jgi:hypothetical protein
VHELINNMTPTTAPSNACGRNTHRILAGINNPCKVSNPADLTG